MSGPCHTPKPLVAPKPSLASEVCQSIVGNVDVTSSDRPELKQDSESDVSQDEADASREDECVHKHLSNMVNKFIVNTNHETTYSDGTEEDLGAVLDKMMGEEESTDDAAEEQHTACLNLVKELDVGLNSADEDHNKTSDDINSTKNGEDANEPPPARLKTHTEDQTAGESAESRDPQNLYAEIEELLSDSCEDPEIDPTYDTKQSHYSERKSTPRGDCAVCDGDLGEEHRCVCHEADEDVTCNESNCSQSSLCEENPYDVIGFDEITWQAERATKDPSGRFRFETVDPFESYSVIEVVPSDLRGTFDPEARCSEDESSNENPMNSEITTEGTSNQELYYVSSDNVVELGEEQAKSENGIALPASACEGKESRNDEAVNHYADVEEQQVDCVSSEDYFEIGDEDDGRSVRERSSKRGHAVLSQRNSRQPHLRLSNITVPADLNSSQTPELTNCVIFAHNTEAFEEDIEVRDHHNVPFTEDTDSDEHIYEEAGFDSEGENFISLDMKSVVTRSRSLSGKITGNVPETVPEETHDYYTLTLDQNGDPHPKPSDPTETNGITPSVKPRGFLLTPLSLSVEGRDLSSPKEESRLQSIDDTLSLPCVITSSGSFFERSRESSSDVSTPSALVDIPPPFELAYTTKRPVTKSSPSLLIQHESPDNHKKKISLKHILTLKFRKKTENKARGDGSVRSSRSSSESSHHGPCQVLDPPQLHSHVTKPQHNSALTTTFVPHKERQRRQDAPRNYGSRGVARGESFEERSRPPFMPLPLTKPRSISFPSADTSDYENIPAMSSDYENIRIPRVRSNHAATVTAFFDDQNQTSSAPVNENDGYVDMNGFAGIENKINTQKQENKSVYTEPFPVCPVSPATVSNEDDHGHTSEEEDRDHCHDRQVVCRSCSSNRYPLMYPKERLARVCDHCYAELRKRGGNISESTSPCTHRASRPLSAVFQNLQPQSLWRNRKSSSPLTHVCVRAEGSTMSGSLQRRKKSKRKWKRLWFLLKDKVLYTFKAREDKQASESLALQGFTVKLSDGSEDSVFQLYHKRTLYYTFRADDQHTARRWVNAMEEATALQ